MKRIKFVLLFVTLSQLLTAQKLEKIKLFSTFVNDSIPVKVWLPEDYKPTEKYSVIYEFIYDHSNYLAATMQNMWNVPKTIVVYAQIEGGNEHYSNPQLSATGLKYYSFVKNELISYITQHYHTTYRTAAGLSQGGDYIAYILRNDPQLFNSYLIFSIERPIDYKPNFKSYIENIKDTTSCFIAVPNDDMDERKMFANQLYDSIKTCQYIKIKKEFYQNANHPFSILYSFPDALNFIYNDYSIFRKQLNGESISTYFENVLNEKTNKYGTLNYNEFIINMGSLFKKTDSPLEIHTLLQLINEKPNTFDVDLFNIGYSLFQNEFYDEAEKSFRLALAKQKGKEVKMDISSIYSWLSKTYEKRGQDSKALKILEEGNVETKNKCDGFLLYRIGSYKIEKNININEGINDLKTLLSEIKKNKISTYMMSNDAIYVELAKAYWTQKDKKNAKENLKKALEISPTNNDAINLQALIK